MKIDPVLIRRLPAGLRIIVFTLILLLLWLPIALPMYALIGDRNLVGILTLLVLYAEFIWLVRRWGKLVHRQSQMLWHYGLEWTPRLGRDLGAGLAVGLGCVALLIGVETLLGWVSWRSPGPGLGRVILEGLVVAVALGFAEELLFRGWMLDELQRDYAPVVVLWANAILFAALHLRLWTFPALVLLGVALVWAKRSRGEWVLGKRRDHLGLPWGLHSGLVYGNYILEVGKLITYTGKAPEWMTGLDRNPVASVMGLALLGGLALGMWQWARSQTRTRPLL